MLIAQFRRLETHKLHEVGYERMVAEPERYLRRCLEFLGEDPEGLDYSRVKTYETKDRYKNTLSQDEIRQVLKDTEPYFSQYGYSVN